MWKLKNLFLISIFGALSTPGIAQEREVLEVFVSPYNVTIDSGVSKPMAVRVLYSDGYEMYPQGVTWHSSNPEVSPISENGVVFGVKSGLTLISATYKGVNSSQPATVKVGEAVIDEITVEFPHRNMVVGESQQAQAQATYSDGSQQDVTSSVQWQVVNSSKELTVSEDGVVTAHEEGYGLLIARADGVRSQEIRIDVSEGQSEFQWVMPFPSSTTMAVGSQFTPSIRGLHNSGSIMDINEIDGWVIDNPSIVRATPDNQAITAVGKGTAIVYPIAAGLQSIEPVTVTVE
ncbi:Ig-like domain-containing protein [Photobacterium rosenbergii]|uniref:Ig-like domain-containing protein n=1 Tax=Photobacterium rosenbergii TaxID=294936 RepID=UPI001C99EC30|nr:Ig-like domain-containing protein [Photobacterium rosenbergii]MBY5945127.1 Ig-like domain-containing protein [Photobacterium rosenbergii]